jgi:hypothetical protein
MNVEAFAVLAVTKIRIERQTKRQARYVARRANDTACSLYMSVTRNLHLVARNLRIVAKGVAKSGVWRDLPWRDFEVRDVAWLPGPDSNQRPTG